MAAPDAGSPGWFQIGRFFARDGQNSTAKSHVGKDCSVQKFFEGETSSSSSGAVTWNDFASPALAHPRKIKYEGAAFQLYHRFISTRDKFADGKSGNFNSVQEYYVSKIRIQSPYIRACLESTFSKYGLNYGPDKTAHSTWPHEALFFSRDKIAEFAKEHEDESTRLHCSLLGAEIEKALDDILEELQELQKAKEITFDLLWTRFPEGSIFATEVNGSLRALRVKEYSAKHYEFRMICEEVRYDGFRYGISEFHIRVEWFEGRHHINKIPGLPVYDADPGQPLRKRLLERGKKILDFQGIHYVAHNPAPANIDPQSATQGDSSTLKNTVAERVVVDYCLYQAFKSRIYVEPLRSRHTRGPDTESPSDEAQTKMKTLAENWEMRRPTAAEMEANRQLVLENEENLILLHPKLEGFSLHTNDWSRFEVDHIHPIEYDPNIFDYVVYDRRKKELLRTLVESHEENGYKYDEFIFGKGESLLVLLTGESGTGKTLMAESVADHLRRPLLRFTPTEKTIDFNLTSPMHSGLSVIPYHVQIASDWGAIMIYDDANFENKSFLFSFLRQVEYFKGIVFFTSNSALQQHPAVKSRAQVHLLFESLTPSMRKEIWINFNKRLPSDMEPLSDSSLDELSTWRMNGRQIKNALNMTVSWCLRRKQPMGLAIVKEVISLTCPAAVQDPPVTSGMDLLDWEGDDE